MPPRRRDDATIAAVTGCETRCPGIFARGGATRGASPVGDPGGRTMSLLLRNATVLGGDAGDRVIGDPGPGQERGPVHRYGMEARTGRRP